MLRDLGLRLERGGGLVDRIVIPAAASARAAHGGVRAGIVATGVDVVAAIVALRSLAPDWLATTELSLWTRETRQTGPVAGEARLLRGGRSNAVIEVNLVDEGADRRPLALAVAVFARIQRPDAAATFADDSGERVVVAFGGDGSDLSRPFVDGLGVSVRDAGAGVVELPRDDYTINSFGSLQGGMVALLVELAVEAASGARGTATSVRDLSIHYLKSGLSGPYRTRAALLRDDGDQSLWRVAVEDVGAGHCMAVATAGARAGTASP